MFQLPIPVLLKARKLVDAAMLPRYQTDGAACFDLHAVDGWTVAPGAAHAFRTGLAFEVPAGHAMMIYSRSGHGFAHDVRLANCVGVIDSDYRGEVQVKLTNDGTEPMRVLPGDRIAQAMVMPVPAVHIVEADSLSETARGAGGFGSTGI